MQSHFTLDRGLDYAGASRARRGVRTLTYGSESQLLKLQRVLRRHWAILLACVLFGVAAGVIHSKVEPGDLVAILGAWTGIGFGIGAIILVAREIMRDAIDFKLLQDRVPYSVLGAAPAITPTALRQLQPDQRSPVGVITNFPASRFATAFRDFQDTLPNQTILSFIGSVPGDGASSVALCAAASAAQQGRQVLLIDCDLRQRSATRTLGFEPDEGILEACEDPEAWRDFLCEDHETGFHILPAAKPRSAWRSLIGAEGLPEILDLVRSEYDLVLLDCPPALGSAEGAMIARLADRKIVVTAWDDTPFNALRNSMKALRARPRPTDVGIYVNRVPPGYKLRRVRAD